MGVYTVRRYLLFAVSLFINAFGIAFITKASLGTSPITSVTYVASMFTPLTMGQWTIMLNMLFVLLELPFMTRRDIKSDLRMYLLQIPVSLCFGMFIDVSMDALFWLAPAGYAGRIGVLLVGCVILSAGIALEVKADIAMMAGEYFVKAISRRLRRDFGYVKLGFDVTLVVVACVLSLVFMSELRGVREGTVVAAMLVGPIVHMISPYYRCLDYWIGRSGQDGKPVAAGCVGVVITIAREYGSGGHELGEMLSRELNLKLYDREFIGMAAQRSGMDERYIIENEQSIPSFWLKCMFAMNNERSVEHGFSPDDVLFVAESRIVQELAERGPCIIVGRCADFVLKDRPNVIRIFCYSDAASACERCVREYGIAPERAEAEIKRVNRNRIAHYEYYTGMKWGEPHHNNLMINTGSIDLKTACGLVKSLYDNIGHRKQA